MVMVKNQHRGLSLCNRSKSIPIILPKPFNYVVKVTWDLIRGVGGAWADPPTSKKGTFFLMTLVLSVPIFNKKSHRTKAAECLKH